MACRERNCDRRKEEVGFGSLEPLLSRPGPAFARTRHARHMDSLLTASPDRPPLAGNRHIIRPPACPIRRRCWVSCQGGLNMALTYHTRQSGDVTILDLNGRLSLGGGGAFGPGSGVVLGDRVRELAKKGQKRILLNLAGLTYVDSSGVGQLVGALTTARNQDDDVKLLKPSSQIVGLLKTTKLDTVSDIHEDEAAAIQSFSKGAAARA